MTSHVSGNWLGGRSVSDLYGIFEENTIQGATLAVLQLITAVRTRAMRSRTVDATGKRPRSRRLGQAERRIEMILPAVCAIGASESGHRATGVEHHRHALLRCPDVQVDEVIPVLA